MGSLPGTRRMVRKVRALGRTVTVIGREAVRSALARSGAAAPAAQRGGIPDGIPDPPRTFAYTAAASVDVAAPAERVFSVLAAPASFGDWLTIHVGFPGGAAPDLVEGETFVQRVKVMGMPGEMRWTVVKLDAPTTVWLEGEGPMGISVGCYYTAVPGSVGTTVHVDAGVEGDSIKGPMGPLVMRNLADAMQKSLERLAESITERAEAPSGAGERRQEATHRARQRRTRPSRRKPAPILHQPTGTRVDPWTPVIVGAGQVVHRDTGTVAGRDPVSLAAEALRNAGDDSGVGESLLASADSVRFVASVSWTYTNGAALIASALGATPTETVQSSPFGGDGSQRLITDTAADIAEGRIDVALIGGAESGATAMAAQGRGVTPDWPDQVGEPRPTKVIGVDHGPNNEVETATGLVAPIYVYSLLETAIRRRLGMDKREHTERITRLWSTFSEVAAKNPYAWRGEVVTAQRLATSDGQNRPISDPYPKLLTANLQVDQASGLILCSAAAADAAGVPHDKWIFVHAGAHAQEEWFVSERAELAASPAIRAMGAAALEHAGIGIDDVAHVDLYACFPSAVQIAADELGLEIDDPQRPLTVTGGLTFAGGPGNNYTSHAVANLVPRLRDEPASYGLATAVGWYMTKHAIGIYSARPPRTTFRQIDAGLRAQRPPARRVSRDYTGRATVEAYTVPYTRSGEPDAVIISALTPEGTRVLVRSKDPSVVASAVANDPLRWQITVEGPDRFSVTDVTDVTDSGELRPLPAVGEPPLLVEWHGQITVFRINRPHARNAIDLATAQAIERAIDAFEADDHARVGILTGVGGTFCSGMDLKAAATGEFPVTEDRGPLGLTARPPIKPLIAAVEGYALAGGCELALAADIIVAAEDALFGLPEPKRGLVAAAGGVLRLTQRLPRSTVLEMVLTGAPVTATRLYELGLVNRITSTAEVLEVAMGLAAEIASNAPLSVELSKQIVDECPDWPVGEAFERQADIASDALFSADAEEGVRAFAEGREPEWKGY